jgi:hypothetical protein
VEAAKVVEMTHQIIGAILGALHLSH